MWFSKFNSAAWQRATHRRMSGGSDAGSRKVGSEGGDFLVSSPLVGEEEKSWVWAERSEAQALDFSGEG
jgi:hypothetical protein